MGHPVITKIERQKRRDSRVSIFLDGEFAFGAQDDVVYLYGLSKGMELTPELRVQIDARNAVLEAKLAAHRLLARRLRAAGELRMQLRKKGFPQAAADEAVDDFVRAGLIDDRAFAVAFVRDRMKFRPKSRRMLERELAARGVSKALVHAVLSEELGEDAERESARALAEKHLARMSGASPEQRYRRVFAFLQRRGYSASLIASVLKGVGNEEESFG